MLLHPALKQAVSQNIANEHSLISFALNEFWGSLVFVF